MVRKLPCRLPRLRSSLFEFDSSFAAASKVLQLYSSLTFDDTMWDGFSEDDINRLKRGECAPAKGKELSSSVPVPKRQFSHHRGSAKKNVARERMLQRPFKPSVDDVKSLESIPENARLSKPKNEENKEQSEPTSSYVGKEAANEPEAQSPNSEPPQSALTLSNDKRSSIETNPNQGPVCIKIKEGKNYEVMSSDKSPLDEFQSRHKLMEEQNRRRKELLAKALADRKKQTSAEVRRLQQIQEELQKLDVLLSNDVAILRNQIEAASFEFMDAQKRYDKAEKEFLEAKLNLFSKLERKELLTEHLCKIIEQNELRKAKKLSELMDKLDIGGLSEKFEDELKNTIGPVILPTLCALDEVSYTACNTLKHRKTEIVSNVDTSVKELKSPSYNIEQSNNVPFEKDSKHIASPEMKKQIVSNNEVPLENDPKNISSKMEEEKVILINNILAVTDLEIPSCLLLNEETVVCDDFPSKKNSKNIISLEMGKDEVVVANNSSDVNS